jgi:hypothetical protein
VAVASRLIEEVDEMEQALVKRCVELTDQAETIGDLTNYHWRLQAAQDSRSSSATFSTSCSA